MTDRAVGLQDRRRLPLRAHGRCGEFGFNGVFHNVRENEFIIQTFEFEGAPDMVNIEFMWFEDLGDGRSRLRGRSICPNIEARDAPAVVGHGGRHDRGLREARRAVEEPLMDWTAVALTVTRPRHG